MSTPTRIKLRNAGDAIVVHVETAQLSKTGKWPEVELFGRDAKTHQQVLVAIPQKSAERQLDRLGLTLNDLPGYTMGVSRGANVEAPDKPYWNLAVVGEPDRQAPARDYLPDQPVRGTAPIASTPEPPPPTDADAPPDAIVPPQVASGGFSDPLYLAITRWVLTEVAPLYEDQEVGPTPEALAAMVATLYIQHRRG